MAKIHLNTSSSSSDEPGFMGKLFQSLFLAFFLGFGLFFFWMIGQSVQKSFVARNWDKTSCRVLASSVENAGSNTGYEFQIDYSYSYRGQNYRSKQFSLSRKTDSDYSSLQKLELKYPSGTEVSCYVNPNNPQEAIIEQGSLLFPLVLLFPSIFILIGASGIFLVWFGKREDSSISSRASNKTGSWGGVIFFALFFFFGLGFLWLFFLKSLVGIYDAQSWNAVDCKVISSRVRSHSGDDGTTYSVDILYQYQIGNKTYKSNRYQFFGGSSSGYQGKREIVDQYPSGQEFKCYVDPNDPTEAVIERSFTALMLIGLLPLFFVVVGLLGINYSLRKRKKDISSISTGGLSYRDVGTENWLPEYPSSSRLASDGTRILKSQSSPLKSLLAIIFFAAFWNGFLFFILPDLIKSWQSGNPDWFLSLFMIPFVLVGVGLILAVLYSFLALFNPRPQVCINKESIYLGDTLSLNWKISRSSSRIFKFSIILEGVEEATYRRGTNTYTDRNTFASFKIVETEQPLSISAGEAQVTIPQNTMHSLDVASNKIIWKLAVKGEIKWWPDVSQNYPLLVLPQA